MGEREERIGLNEALFREVNERVKDINDSVGGRLAAAEFVCECGDDSCTDRIRMQLSEYEHVRSDATHFAVKAGHEFEDLEDVIERGEGYVVVAKKAAAARIAEETDPRE